VIKHITMKKKIEVKLDNRIQRIKWIGDIS
jgi:hypothetical protein